MEGGKGAEGGSGARPKGKGASAVGSQHCAYNGAVLIATKDTSIRAFLALRPALVQALGGVEGEMGCVELETFGCFH